MYYIAHHGVKGQEHGVRRWQYKDGSLTPEGYIHYGYGKKRTAIGSYVANNTSSDDLSNTRTQDEGSNSEVAVLVTNILMDLVFMNPVTLAMDSARLVQAGYAFCKEKGYEKKRSKSPVEEATGLRVKQYDATWKEDMDAVNPGFLNFNTNTKSNCMLASMAYDLRRRGFDVAAGKNSQGFLETKLQDWYPDAKTVKLYSSGDKNNVASRIGVNFKLSKDIADTLSKEPPNSRGIVTISYAGEFSGHAYFYQVDSNGNGYFLDPQANKKYSLTNNPIKYASEVSYTRVDNVKFDPKAVKEYVR